MINNYYIGTGSGQFILKTNISGVTSYSTIMASACEMHQIEGVSSPYPNNLLPMQGNAIMTIHNIVCYDNGDVWIVLDTGWTDYEINFMVNMYGQQ